MQLSSSLLGGFLKASVKEIGKWSHLVPCRELESYTRNLIESTPYIQKGEETNLWYCIVAFAFALWKLIDKNIKRLKALNIQFVFSNLYTINYIRKNIKSFCSSVSETWQLILNDRRLFWFWNWGNIPGKRWENRVF